MRLIDLFFTWIQFIQDWIEKIEKWYKTKRKYVPLVYILTFIVGIVLIWLKQIILGEIFFIFGMVFAGVDNIIGWKHSVRKWLKLCIFYNLFFSLIFAVFVQGMVKSAIADVVFVIIYLLVWIFLSLISNSKVALLVNEIVSGVTATIFTIGTYLVSIALKNKPTLRDYLQYFQTKESFELAIANENAFLGEFFEIMCLEMLERIFLSLLPIIGVSALCIIMIKIKEYWLEKNKTKEPKNSVGKKL